MLLAPEKKKDSPKPKAVNDKDDGNAAAKLSLEHPDKNQSSVH